MIHLALYPFVFPYCCIEQRLGDLSVALLKLVA